MCKPLALMTTFNMWLQRLLVSTLKVESSCVPFCFPFVLSWSRHKHKDNSMSPMQIKYSVLYSSPQYILFGHTHLHCTSYSNIFYFLEQSSHMKSCLDRASSWIHTSANKQGLIEKYCHVAIGHWLESESHQVPLTNSKVSTATFPTTRQQWKAFEHIVDTFSTVTPEATSSRQMLSFFHSASSPCKHSAEKGAQTTHSVYPSPNPTKYSTGGSTNHVYCEASFSAGGSKVLSMHHLPERIL